MDKELLGNQKRESREESIEELVAKLESKGKKIKILDQGRAS